MRVKKALITSVIFFVAFAYFFEPVRIAEAAGVSMSQGILPVHFVYLDEKAYVERMWSNVGAKDDAYVVIFYDYRERVVPADRKLLDKFAAKKMEEVSFEYGKDVRFVKTENGLEQIETIV